MTEKDEQDAPKEWDRVHIIRQDDVIYAKMFARKDGELWGRGEIIPSRCSVSYRLNDDRESADRMADLYDRMMEVFALSDISFSSNDDMDVLLDQETLDLSDA